jgi:4-amino-4-deoxy-L-arabinose transferase-like glycosyltransferase
MDNKRITIGIFVAAIIVYVIGLFPEVGIDSGKYAAVSRIMFENGDLLHPQIHGHDYLQKPHLIFWLSTLSFHIFGLSLFAFKLPTLLFSLASVFALYKLTSLFYSKQVAQLAALVYTTSEMMFLYHNDLHTDALLTANVIIGITFIMYFLHQKKAIHFISGFVFLGLAMITKGPIGLAVAVFAIGGHLLVKKDWKNIFNPVWLLALPILAIVLFPTLKTNYDNFGWEGVEFFFWTNNVGRISGSYNKTVDGDISFYLHTMIYIYLPWSLYALVTIGKHIGSLFTKKADRFKRPEYLTYSVVVVYTLILSIASQKAPHYFFPVVPFLSIIIAQFLDKNISQTTGSINLKWFYSTRNLMLVLIWIVVFLAIAFIFKTSNFFIWITVIAGLLAVIYFVRPKVNSYYKLVLPLAISSIVLNFVINAHFIPTAFQYHGGIRASDAYNKLANDEEELYTYKFNQFETYFYPKKISQWVKEKEDLYGLEKEKDFWLVTDKKGIDEVRELFASRIGEEKVFKHRLISRMSPAFLNPVTRDSELENIYLLKIN